MFVCVCVCMLHFIWPMLYVVDPEPSCDLPINMNGDSLAFLENLLACAASSSSKKDFELILITLLSFLSVNKLSVPLCVRRCKQVNNVGLALRSKELVPSCGELGTKRNKFAV